MNGIDHHSAYEKCTVGSVEVIKSLSDSKIVSPTYKLGSDIVVEMKRIQEMNENITKTMDNQESDSSILD